MASKTDKDFRVEYRFAKSALAQNLRMWDGIKGLRAGLRVHGVFQKLAPGGVLEAYPPKYRDAESARDRGRRTPLSVKGTLDRLRHNAYCLTPDGKSRTIRGALRAQSSSKPRP